MPAVLTNTNQMRITEWHQSTKIQYGPVEANRKCDNKHHKGTDTNKSCIKMARPGKCGNGDGNKLDRRKGGEGKQTEWHRVPPTRGKYLKKGASVPSKGRLRRKMAGRDGNRPLYDRN